MRIFTLLLLLIIRRFALAYDLKLANLKRRDLDYDIGFKYFTQFGLGHTFYD